MCALWFAGILPPSASAADFSGTIVLGRPTDKSIAANVLAPTAQNLFVEFGTQPGSYPGQSNQVPLAANQPAELELSALSPNTRYYYRLRFRLPGANTFDVTPEYSFMTSRAPGSTFIFGVQGDSHPERVNQMFNSAFYTRTLQTVAADNPDFFLTLGDDFSVDQINQANPRAVTQAQVVERYTIQRPYLGIIGKSAPIFLINGNHEQAARYLLDGTPNNVAVWAQNARNLFYSQPAPDAFYSGNPEVIPNIAGPLRNYFAWTWGDALFVAIDPYWGSPVVVDNDFYGGNKRSDLWDVTHGEAQYQWLKSTLEQSKAKYKFVFAHHVLGTQRGGIDVALKYEWGGQNNNGSLGFAANRPNWALPIHQLMAANKVTIFFQGHDHIFVHQQLDGVTYQSLGNPADPNYSLFNADAYATGERFPNSGYARVTVTPTGVKVDYVRTYLTADESPTRKNGTVEFSYSLGSVSELTAAPVITQQPQAQTVAAGAAANFAVSATSSLPLSYQWKRDGFDLPGATTAVLSLPKVQATDAGNYSVVVTTTAGTATSTAVPLALGSSRLVNLSARASAASGNETMIVGFTINGSASLPVLMRGVGPTLGALGVPGTLADPALTLSSESGAALATNDDWGKAANPTQISAAATQVGAFTLPASSLDAALLTSLAPGRYSAVLAGKSVVPGIALLEAYDASTIPAAARLVNISARAAVGTGGSVLIAGFVVQGNVSKQVLIRGVGPTLAAFGLGGLLTDPQLALFREGTATPIQQNDNWLSSPNAAQIGLAAGQVGAFALPANSRDAALLVTLDPGTYTALVTGAAGTTGVALVEIYEVP